MKHNTILAAIALFLLFIILQIPSHAQNIVKADSVIFKGKYKAYIVGIDINGNRCYIKYGFGKKEKPLVVPGVALYVEELRGKRGKFQRTKITIYEY